MDAEIRAVTLKIWRATLDLEVRPAEGGELPGQCPQTTVGYVHVTGAFDGVVIIRSSAVLARRVAGVMFGRSPAEVSAADALEAMAEIVNITGGNLKSLLPEPSRLSLPMVIEGRDCIVATPESRLVAQAAFHCDGEPFLVALHEANGGSVPKAV